MAKKPPPPPSSSEEEENESSSPDDEEEEQQIITKPAPQTPSKPDSDDSEADASDSEDSEHAPQESQSAPSKSLFKRIWSLDDEITILESIAEYQSEHGPIKVMPGAIGGFCDFVKGRLSFDVTGTQLADKIRRLKRKYSLMVGRARGGRAMKLARSHDKKMYKLSKKLWGQGNEEDGEKGKKVAEVGATVNGRGRKGKREWPLLRETLGSMGNEMVVSELLEGIDGEKAGFLERKLKKQKVVELKHQISRADLIKESMKLVLEGLKRADY